MKKFRFFFASVLFAGLLTSVIVFAQFVPVTGITNVPDKVSITFPFVFSGLALPGDATNQTITWTVLSAGLTGAQIKGLHPFTL